MKTPRTTTSKADPGSTNLAEEIDAGGGDTDLHLEDRRQDEPARTPRREDDDERDERKPADLRYEEDPRDALFAKIGERRAEQGQELSTEAEDDEAEEQAELDGEETDPEVVIVAGPGAREVNQPHPDKPAPRKVTDLQDDDIVIVKVDGAEVEMRYGDMKSRAQQHVAADTRLDDAKRLLTEVRDLVRTQNTRPAPASEQRPAGDVKPDATRRAPDGQSQADRKARLADIVDKLQTETPEKAVEALEGLISELRPEGNTSPAVDVATVARQTYAEEESDRAARLEIASSFQAVAEPFGDILADQKLANMAFSSATDAIVSALRAAGTPDEDFAYIADLVDANNAKITDPTAARDSFGLAIMRKYAEVARNPAFKLKPVKQIMDEGFRSTRKWYTGDENKPANDKGKALPAPAGNGSDRGASAATPRPRVVISSTRTERKAGVSTQPRSASMRTDFSSTGPAVRKDTSKTIAQMAEGRR